MNLLRTPNIGFIKSFNPVCFWFLETQEGCKFFVAEVKNTFHEDQIYIIENNGDTISENIWLEVEKNMYVSPFAEKSGFYKFNLSRNPFKIKINQFNKEKKAKKMIRRDLAAVFIGFAFSIFLAFMSNPSMTF